MLCEARHWYGLLERVPNPFRLRKGKRFAPDQMNDAQRGNESFCAAEMKRSWDNNPISYIRYPISVNGNASGLLLPPTRQRASTMTSYLTPGFAGGELFNPRKSLPVHVEGRWTDQENSTGMRQCMPVLGHITSHYGSISLPST